MTTWIGHKRQAFLQDQLLELQLGSKGKAKYLLVKEGKSLEQLPFPPSSKNQQICVCTDRGLNRILSILKVENSTIQSHFSMSKIEGILLIFFH